MKKYIIPSAKLIELGVESLLATSLTKGEGSIENENQILTQEQSSQSIWDYWKD